jgi:hypothetical protein
MTFWQRLHFLISGVWPKSRHVTIPGDDLHPAQAQKVRVEWLRALAQHPGFIWLMSDLEEKKAIHEERMRPSGVAALVNQYGLDGLLQYSIATAKAEEASYWLGYIQHLVRRANAMPELRSRPNQVQ